MGSAADRRAVYLAGTSHIAPSKISVQGDSSDWKFIDTVVKPQKAAMAPLSCAIRNHKRSAVCEQASSHSAFDAAMRMNTRAPALNAFPRWFDLSSILTRDSESTSFRRHGSRGELISDRVVSLSIPFTSTSSLKPNNRASRLATPQMPRQSLGSNHIRVATNRTNNTRNSTG